MDEANASGRRWAEGHRPLVGFRIVTNPPRLPADLVEHFSAFFVPDIADLVGQLYVMDAGIRPLYAPMATLTGSALTVKLTPGDNSVIKRAYEMVRPGDVLVVDARGHTATCAGGAASMVPAIHEGLAGVVVDGAWRDVGELQAIGLPVFGRGVCPYSGPKQRPGEINVPVCCGGVIVNPGDIIAASTEGAVVVPVRYAQAVADSLRAYAEPASLADFDHDRLRRSNRERDEWFETHLRTIGSEYLDWSER
jgi:4-hydroxy-4-methyl-2-oxoglutarate aldolase